MRVQLPCFRNSGRPVENKPTPCHRQLSASIQLVISEVEKGKLRHDLNSSTQRLMKVSSVKRLMSNNNDNHLPIIRTQFQWRLANVELRFVPLHLLLWIPSMSCYMRVVSDRVLAAELHIILKHRIARNASGSPCLYRWPARAFCPPFSHSTRKSRHNRFLC